MKVLLELKSPGSPHGEEPCVDLVLAMLEDMRAEPVRGYPRLDPVRCPHVRAATYNAIKHGGSIKLVDLSEEDSQSTEQHSSHVRWNISGFVPRWFGRVFDEAREIQDHGRC